MNIVGKVEGSVTNGETKTGTRGKKRVLGGITRTTEMMTVTTDTGPAEGDINHVHHQRNGIVMRSTGKAVSGRRLPRELVLWIIVNIEDIDDTMTTIPERKDAIRAVLLLHVAPGHQHSLFQRLQSLRKGRDQYLYLMMIMKRPTNRCGIRVVATLGLLPGHPKHPQTMKL
jgi:hypothetical protein